MSRHFWMIPAAACAVVIVAAGPASAAADKSKSPAGADKSKSGAILPGGNSGKPVNISAAKLDYFDKEQKLIYTGNVVATQGDSTLKSTVLTIFLAPKKKAGETQQPGQPAQSTTSQVQRMLAKGPVTLLQRDQVGTGDNGTYDKLLNTVILTGHVVLTQGPNVTKGDKLVYDLKSGQAKVTADAGHPVLSMFIPDDSSSQPSAAPAPAAAPAPRRRNSRRAAQ